MNETKCCWDLAMEIQREWSVCGDVYKKIYESSRGAKDSSCKQYSDSSSLGDLQVSFGHDKECNNFIYLIFFY